MTLIDDTCDGCGSRFDPMGDPILKKHPEIGPYAVFCATCEHKAATAKRDPWRPARLTDSESAWVTTLWDGRRGRLAEAKRDLEQIIAARVNAALAAAENQIEAWALHQDNANPNIERGFAFGVTGATRIVRAARTAS